MTKKIIGYTTGVYDMFHIGHLNLLEQARAHCDELIVGVSSDELVQQYKHKSPVIPFAHRQRIIAALKCVDRVVAQTHRDKIKQFEEVGYDVMFVGDDWKGSAVFSELENHLQQHGAKIIYFAYTQKVSSTKFTQVLQDIYDSESSVK